MLRQTRSATPSTKPLRIAIINYQRCIFWFKNQSDPYFLSPKLIEFIKNQGYEYFVGHTMRCIANTDAVKATALNNKNMPVSEREKYEKNYSIDQVTKHIEEESGLSCLTVATMDDLVEEKIGDGYADLISYETEKKETSHPHLTYGQQFQSYDRNNELYLKVAADLAERFPKRFIQLDIIDNDLPHCRAAWQASSQAGWPEVVKITQVWRFDADLQNDMVTAVDENNVPKVRKQAQRSENAVSQSAAVAVSSSQPVSLSALPTRSTASVSSSRAGLFAPPVNAPVMEPRRSERLKEKNSR